ncbi:MAG: thymidylate synthase [Clostridiales bacterium]|nr:thymidylate synthase [Clostridiales bacterium]
MNVDVEVTGKYYDELKDEDLCSCGYCKEYRRQVRAAYPEVSVYLDGIGIDIGKPSESMYWDVDPDGLVDFTAYYWVFGEIGNFEHKIGDVHIYTDHNIHFNVPALVAAVDRSQHFMLAVSTIRINTGIRRE